MLIYIYICTCNAYNFWTIFWLGYYHIFAVYHLRGASPRWYPSSFSRQPACLLAAGLRAGWLPASLHPCLTAPACLAWTVCLPACSFAYPFDSRCVNGKCCNAPFRARACFLWCLQNTACLAKDTEQWLRRLAVARCVFGSCCPGPFCNDFMLRLFCYFRCPGIP